MCEKCGCTDFLVDGQIPAYQCMKCKHIVFLDKEEE